MFQFTTTTVVNSLTDPVNGNNILTYKGATGAPAKWKDNVVLIQKVGKFVKDNVTAIYKTAPVAGVKEKIVLNLSKLTDFTKTYRLYIYIGLTLASHNSLYSNDFYTKGKPFSLDFQAKGAAAATATAIEKTFKKYQLAVYGEKLFTVKANGNNLEIECVDEYLRFRKVEVAEFDPEANYGMGAYKEPKITLDDNTTYTLTPGVESFGSYSWLLHNLRIPTTYNTEYLNSNENEMPVPGAQYTQYTIHYCVNRGILGTNAVGDTVKSKTTHVFYVKSDCTTAFEAALAKLGATNGVKAETSLEDRVTALENA